MNRQFKVWATGVLAALIAPTAFAGPIFFDFSNVTGSDTTVSSYSETVGGITATLTGWGYNSSTGKTGSSYQVYLDDSGNMDGIGVYSGSGDADDLDGWQADEMLQIEFSSLVTLTDLRFLDGDHNYGFSSHDDFDLWADGVQVFDERAIEANDIDGWVSTGSLTASAFWLAADNGADSFYLQGMEVLAAQDPGPGPDPGIPEPGPMALLGLGLLGIGLSRRARKAA